MGLAHNKLYRNFIILQEDERGYSNSKDKALSGYAKVEAKGDKCKVSFYAQNLNPEDNYSMVLICCKKDSKQLIDLGPLTINEVGKADTSKEYYINNIAGLGISYEKISGAAICRIKGGEAGFIMHGFMNGEESTENWRKFKLVRVEEKKSNSKTNLAAKNIEVAKVNAKTIDKPIAKEIPKSVVEPQDVEAKIAEEVSIKPSNEKIKAEVNIEHEVLERDNLKADIKIDDSQVNINEKETIDILPEEDRSKKCGKDDNKHKKCDKDDSKHIKCDKDGECEKYHEDHEKHEKHHEDHVELGKQYCDKDDSKNIKCDKDGECEKYHEDHEKHEKHHEDHIEHGKEYCDKDDSKNIKCDKDGECEKYHEDHEKHEKHHEDYIDLGKECYDKEDSKHKKCDKYDVKFEKYYDKCGKHHDDHIEYDKGYYDEDYNKYKKCDKCDNKYKEYDKDKKKGMEYDKYIKEEKYDKKETKYSVEEHIEKLTEKLEEYEGKINFDIELEGDFLIYGIIKNKMASGCNWRKFKINKYCHPKFYSSIKKQDNSKRIEENTRTDALDFEQYEKEIQKVNNPVDDFSIKGEAGKYFENLAEDFEHYNQKLNDINYCKWYKVDVNSIEDLCDQSNYNKYTLAYYPMLNYYPYINKSNHFLLGYKCNKAGELQYIVYGIPGSKDKDEQPFGGKTGFVTWTNDNTRNQGYWLMFYDYKNSSIVVPMK